MLVDARVEDTGRAGSHRRVWLAGEQRRRAAVAEDRRADGLRARVLGGGRRQEAAHALGGDHERVLAGLFASVCEASRTSGTRARAADAGDVVLVGRRVHVVVLRRAGARAWAAERVEARADDRADRRRGRSSSASIARIEWRSSSCSIRAVRPCRVSARNSSLRFRCRRLTPAAREDALGELVALQAEPLEDLRPGSSCAGVGDRESRDPRAGVVQAAPVRSVLRGGSGGWPPSASALGKAETLWLSERT